MQTSSSSNFQDKTLTCRECGSEFVWTAGEQDFYQRKGFENPPFRCAQCRAKKKAERMANRTMTKIICAKCGKEDEVPFVPKEGTPVLCKDCFRLEKQRAV